MALFRMSLIKTCDQTARGLGDSRSIQPEKKVDPPRGLYLPLWVFYFGVWLITPVKSLRMALFLMNLSRAAGSKSATAIRSSPTTFRSRPAVNCRLPSCGSSRLRPEAVKPYDPVIWRIGPLNFTMCRWPMPRWTRARRPLPS